MFEHLDVEAYDREYTDRELARRVGVYIARYKRRAALIVTAVVVLALLQASIPVMVARGVGTMAAFGGGVWLLAVAVLLAWIAVWGLNYMRRRSAARLLGDVILDLRRDAFRAAVHHDLSFYDQFASGRIVNRITTDTNDFAQTVLLLTDVMFQLMVMVVLAAVLVFISPPMSLLLFLWAPIVVLLALGFRRLARYVTRQGSRAMADVNAMISETVAGIAVAKNFRRESTVYADFGDVNVRSYRINLRRGFVLANVFPVLNCLAGLGTGALVYFGGLGAVTGAIYLGAWYLFLQSVEAFLFPLINLASFWSQVQAGLSAIERVFALIDYESTVLQLESGPVPHLDGDIRFEKVCLRYRGGAVVLPGLDLHIRPGESVALVGHTGAGKSSIARLVARFYEFQEGRLLIDGRDVRRLDLAEYRRHLGIVPQTPFLFNGSVLENIRYAKPDATEAEVRSVADGIGDGEWLAALPDGLATVVGERGTNLSMGQRQLVALARVLVQRPEIFILDEATASVDPFTEAEIQEALDLILGQSTSIVIAHRLSTVRAADRIVVLAEGQVLEQGSHTALMTSGGHYAELYDTYFRHQSPDYQVDLTPASAA
jgi:ATP-binding cassette, subfamily B, bacterial